MAQIAPFPGLHYDPTRVSLNTVIAPPYDVLSPAQQDALHAQSPDNIVRLILSKEEPGDNAEQNRYTRAASFLREELAKGVMVQDAEPALYEYIQRFPHPLSPKQTVERRALFVALKLEPYENGVVLPHEETHPKAKADRLDLMRATEANPEPIYGLYEDPEQTVANSLTTSRGDAAPLLSADATGAYGPEEHRIYRHTDPHLLAELEDFFASRRVWIADGHHRYETALNYQKEKGGNASPADYLLIGLSAFEDLGLVVLPTHRLVRNVSEARLESLALQLDRFFTVQSLPVEAARTWLREQIAGQHQFVIVTKNSTYALTLRDNSLLDTAMDASHCEAWRRLDVSILQTFVLDRTLGISYRDLAHTPDVSYTRDEDEAVQKVRTGEYDLACLLQNPSVTEVRDVASAGDKMPQKSTFFYPKLWSGLVLRSLR